MKIPFMLFIEPENLGGGLYFVYSKDDEDNCNYLNLISGAYEEGPKVLPGGDLAKSYLEEECESLDNLQPHTMEYLKWIFKENGYNPDAIGNLVDSLDKLEDIKVNEFENMAKIRESIKIKDDGTLDYDAMTEEEKEKFFKDLYQLYRADAAVLDGAADDGEELNDLKIDRWNESLNLNNIDVDKTPDDTRRDYLNEGQFSAIKKIHTWVPGKVNEKKFDRYTEEVIPVDDHSDTDKFIKKLHLGESREATSKLDFETPEMRLMKRPKKLQESTPNFRSNDGDFPLVVQYLDEAFSMPCPECGFNIYDDPDDEGNRTCDECGYVASEAEWRENCVFDPGLADIIEDEISAGFESALRKFGVDDLKYWFVSMKPGYYQGVQVYVEDSNYSLYDDISYENSVLDALNEIAPDKVSEVYSVLGDDADETDYDNYYSFENLCEDIDNQKAEEEAKRINDFLDYLVKDRGWTKIEKVAVFSNGEAVYRKVEKKAKKSNRIKEARLQEGPGAGYDVEFLGIKITNVKIDEIKLDDYNCQYVEFEADIVPGEYDWNAEGYDWRVDGDSDYFDNYEFYQKAKISGGKVTGSCQNGYQGWADANATWTIDEFVKEIEGESYDLGIMYGGGWSHSDITSPFEMEDEYGIDKSDERSGYKNSYISTASIELEDPGMLNQIIEDTRYYDLYDEDEEEDEEEDLELTTDERQAGQWYESRRHPEPDKWKTGDWVIYKGKRYVTSMFLGGDMVKLENHEGSIVVPQSEVYKATKKDIYGEPKMKESKFEDESESRLYKDMKISKSDLSKIESFLDKMKSDFKHFKVFTLSLIKVVDRIKSQQAADDEYSLDYYSYNEIKKYLDAVEDYLRIDRDLLEDKQGVDSCLKDISDIKHFLNKEVDKNMLNESLDNDDYEDDREDYEGTVEEDLYQLSYLLDKSRSTGLDSYELRLLQSLIDDYGYPEDRNYPDNYNDYEEDEEDENDYNELSYLMKDRWDESLLSGGRLYESSEIPDDELEAILSAAQDKEIYRAFNPKDWTPGNPCAHSRYYQVVGEEDGEKMVKRLKDRYSLRWYRGSYGGTDYEIVPLADTFNDEDILPLSSLSNVKPFDVQDDKTRIRWNEYFD